MKTIKEQVEFVLKNYEDTRNSDALLTMRVWETFYDFGDFMSNKRMRDLLKDCPQTSVVRFRQKFNEENKYLPTSIEVARKRGLNILKWRSELGYRQETNNLSLL